MGDDGDVSHFFPKHKKILLSPSRAEKYRGAPFPWNTARVLLYYVLIKKARQNQPRFPRDFRDSAIPQLRFHAISRRLIRNDKGAARRNKAM
jgi:hypothetical protein